MVNFKVILKVNPRVISRANEKDWTRRGNKCLKRNTNHHPERDMKRAILLYQLA